METKATYQSIILAAGDGRRLATLTRRLHGDDRPKQFAIIRRGRSLLQETIARMQAFSTPDQMSVVVGEQQLSLAREQVCGLRGLDLVVQPRNIGTGPGVLLPLSRVLHRDPDATVVITPSDHHYHRPEQFVRGLSYARTAAAASPSGVCLLAVAPECASTEFGWIVPGAPLPAGGGATFIRRFVEKPDGAIAHQLLERGALWNTFVMVGTARRLWALAARHLPIQTTALEDHLHTARPGSEAEQLRQLYRRLAPADFSKDVLAHASGLVVVAVHGCGWSDWGTQERILASLDGTPDRLALEQRLAGTERGCDRSGPLHSREEDVTLV